MPSYVMHLAIAKKYLETHPEENEEEFYRGTVAPDKRTISQKSGELHYGKNSHKPDLNRYYTENGLNSSYNRGYFLHLLTDYLFYNRFLNEYSIDIYNDYKRMDKKIVKRYGLKVSEWMQEKISSYKGELKTIDEQSVYKFIDAVSGLNLEDYRKQVRAEDKDHKIKLIGQKEGMLFGQKGPTALNEHSETYFYGFENNYGVLIKRKIGFSETEGAREGLYEVTPVGIAVKPSKIGEFRGTDIATVREELTDKETKALVRKCEEALGKKLKFNSDVNFEKMSKDEIKTVLKAIRRLSERTPKKTITDNSLNLDLVKEDDIEIK